MIRPRHAFVAGLSLFGVSLVALSSAFAQSAPAGAPAAMLGFSPAAARDEAALERRFDAQLDPADLKAWMERMASQPNQVGSPHDKENADWTLQQFKKFGFDAHIETFYVLYPTPISEKLELTGPSPYRAKLHEPVVPGDPTSAEMPGVLPPYVAYQGDGDVTAPLVYVNFGMPEDYKALARTGVDVRGKIVITRYGGGWRGLKPKLAQSHGAVGCIIYSDPHEDGYFTDDPYPKGAQRTADGVQRGSVQDITLYSGDPLTPGVAATRDAARLTRDQAQTLMKIPTLPISYADAQPLLAALGGPVAASAFRGALPITYHLGPGPAVVHLAVKSEWGLKPIYDVIAMLPGAKFPDQWVIRGNHHDGWVFGAEDPLSGNVSLLEEAKAVGALAKSGWRPKRTLVYASWDAEEPGLLGSTEWAEAHGPELQKKAVLYLNSDTNGRGFFSAAGSHEFQTLVNQVQTEVRDPETGGGVGDRLRAHLQVEALEPPKTTEGADEIRRLAKAAEEGREIPIEALGSGSDFTPFLQHLGLASLNLEYSGEGANGGYYHSAYDTYAHFERFTDPGFRYGVTLAQTAGRIMLRTADADGPTVEFGGFADAITHYVAELRELTERMRKHDASEVRLIDAGAYRLSADPTKVEAAPTRADAVPMIDLAPLDAAAARLHGSADRFDAAYARAVAAGALTGGRANQLGAALQGIDQTLLDARGLPGRPWYAHLIYAPGLETGYGVKTLPGVREAIEARNWAEAARYVTITAAALNAYTVRIEAATSMLGGGG